MKLLVTGGLGFIGSNFIRHILLKHPEYHVVNIDKVGISANPDNLKDIRDDERYKFIKGDISDFKLVSNVIKDVDAVVNIAAETHVDRSIANPLSFLQSNTIGTFITLEAIRRCNPKIRFVHISTDEIYGEIYEGQFREGDRLTPSNPYSASKAATDMFCLAYYRTYGLDIVITRCTNNFGPYQFPEKFIPKIIIRALKNLLIPIYGTGKHIRDWIHVLDHCEAIDSVLGKGRSGEIYNISAGNELENIKLAKLILKIMDKPEDLITFVEDRPGHDIRYNLDSSKIREELNWKPKYSFEEALRETVQWYVENEKWWSPLAKDEILHSTPWKLKW